MFILLKILEMLDDDDNIGEKVQWNKGIMISLEMTCIFSILC